MLLLISTIPMIILISNLKKFQGGQKNLSSPMAKFFLAMALVFLLNNPLEPLVLVKFIAWTVSQISFWMSIHLPFSISR